MIFYIPALLYVYRLWLSNSDKSQAWRKRFSTTDHFLYRLWVCGVIGYTGLNVVGVLLMSLSY